MGLDKSVGSWDFDFDGPVDSTGSHSDEDVVDVKYQEYDSMEGLVNHNSRSDKQHPINRIREETPRCEDNHETNDRDVFDHEFRGHAYSRDQGRETKQIEEKESLSHQCGGSLATEGSCEDELTCEGNHAMEGREVYDHEIGNHVVDMSHRGEADQIEVESDHQQDVDENTTKPYPWMAPRMLLQHLMQAMDAKEPSMWSIDNYDGEVIWHDHKWKPEEEYRHDQEVNPNQYHKLMNHLYQAESATEDLMIKVQAEGNDNNVEQEWQKIRCSVRGPCLDMLKEV